MGYSSDLFIESPPDNLICGICLDTFKECHVLGCGHRYCLYCLQLLLSTEEQLCAFDRKKIKIFEKDEKMDEIIMNLAVKCDQESCDWLGVLKDKKNHKCKKLNRILIPPPYKTPEKWYDGLILGDKEITLRVLSYLQAPQVARCSRINKNWKKITKNEHLWKFLFKKEFDLNIKMKVTGWKHLFIDNYSYKYPHKFAYLKNNGIKNVEEVKEEESFLGDHFNLILDEEKLVEPLYGLPVQYSKSDERYENYKLVESKNSNVKCFVNDSAPEKRKSNAKDLKYSKPTNQEEEDMLLYYTLELSKKQAPIEEEPLILEDVDVEYEVEYDEDVDYDYDDEYIEDEEEYMEEDEMLEGIEQPTSNKNFENAETFEYFEYKTNTNMYVN